MMKRCLQISILLVLLAINILPAHAQDQPPKPVYIIQQGDTLNIIAARFGVSVDDLITANQISDPNFVTPGMELTIPGLEGVAGKLTTEIIPLGENLMTISRRYRVPVDLLVKLNKITSPSEIFAGASVIIPQDENNPPFNGSFVLSSGQSLLEAAVIHNGNPWSYVGSSNQLNGTWDAQTGSPIYFAAASEAETTSAIPLVDSLTVEKLPLVQGKTAVIRVSTREPLELSGTLLNRKLAFFQPDPAKNEYLAIQGVHALARQGLGLFSLQGNSSDGRQFEFEQMVMVNIGGYAQDPPLFVDPATIDPAATKPEDDQLANITAVVTPERFWDGIFRVPVDEPVCIKSWYGNRRSYNGSEFNYFHTGVDYGVCANLNIYAPAPGKIVFAGPLTVRGNATVIDHGWGVYSGIWHQSAIKVNVGDRVEAGQLIGEIGGTGRVTGPHLHWEIWVNGVQVEPLDWLETAYP